MDSLNQFVTQSLGAIIVVLAIACIVLAILVVVLVRRSSRFERRFAGLTRGEDGQSLESILGTHLERVHALSREVDMLAAKAAVLEQVQRKAFQKVGLVRFNPFEDTGGNQSFALALLDQDGDGFIMSSLHARAGTRIYAKAIAGGKSEAALSGEESEALKDALASGPAKAG